MAPVGGFLPRVGTHSLLFFHDETFVQRKNSIGNASEVGLVPVGWKLSCRAEGVRRSGKVPSVTFGRAQGNLLTFEFSG